MSSQQPWHTITGPVTKGKFNHRSHEDQTSRMIWSANITKRDNMVHREYVRNNVMKKYPHISILEVDHYVNKLLAKERIH